MGAIANHLWQSTVVAAVALALAWLLGNNRASIRHWIWFAASMKFLVPFAALSAALRAVWWPQWAGPENEAAAAVNGLFSFSATAEATFPQSVSWSLIVVWLAGMCLLLARWASEWNRVAAIVSVSPPITAGPVHDAVRRVERAAGIPKPMKIVSSHDNLEPGIVGISKPVLVWPAHLADGLHGDQIESVIAHELSHVVRRDNLLASMHMLTNVVFWFHPIVWWIGARLIEERERACDEHVLGLGQSPAAYAAGILKTCELCVATPLANVSGITGGDLKQRIRRIMQGGTGRPMNARRKTVLALAATVGTRRAHPGRRVRTATADRGAAGRSRRGTSGAECGTSRAEYRAAEVGSRSKASIHAARHTGQNPGRGAHGVRRQDRRPAGRFQDPPFPRSGAR